MFKLFRKKSHDKYDEIHPYLGISTREFIMSTTEYEIKLLRKKIEKSIIKHINRSHKMNNNELDYMYDDVMKSKHSFVDNANMWSRTGTFADRMDIAVHAYEELRDALMEEKKNRKLENS